MSTKDRSSMMKKNRKASRPEIPIVRPPGFQKTYSTRVLASRTEFDFRAVFANEKMQTDDGEEVFIGESLVILTPLAAKELAGQLDMLVKDWEKEHGAVKKRPRKSIYSEQSLSP